jgi:hypothetical protein
MLHLAYESVSKEGTKMRKILFATVAVATLFTATAANADYYRNRGGYHHHGGGGGWVAPLLGGLIVGGIVGGALAEPRYAAPQPYYPYPSTRTICGLEHVYDVYGRYVGDRKTCYEVPN